MRRGVLAHPGSTLGLSQPLSGFLADLSFAALFRAATVPGILSLQSVPLTKIARPSQGRFAPLQLDNQHAETHCTCALSPPLSPTPTLSRSCLDPSDGYGRPFTKPRSCFPFVPQLRTAEPLLFCQPHLLRSFYPFASPFATRPSCPVHGGRCFLGFIPL